MAGCRGALYMFAPRGWLTRHGGANMNLTDDSACTKKYDRGLISILATMCNTEEENGARARGGSKPLNTSRREILAWMARATDRIMRQYSDTFPIHYAQYGALLIVVEFLPHYTAIRIANLHLGSQCRWNPHLRYCRDRIWYPTRAKFNYFLFTSDPWPPYFKLPHANTHHREF